MRQSIMSLPLLLVVILNLSVERGGGRGALAFVAIRSTATTCSIRRTNPSYYNGSTRTLIAYRYSSSFQQQQQCVVPEHSRPALFMATSDDDSGNNKGSSAGSTSTTAASSVASTPTASTVINRLPFWLDPGTKGGVIVLTLLLFLVPILIYNIATSILGLDEIQTGIFIGMGFTVIASLAWVSTYLFRVATKDMTYAKQLKDYEDAVIKKRLEELDEDELQALQEEIDRDKF